MNTFSAAPNVEFVRRRLLALVTSSALPLANARRLALLESCRQAANGADLLDMALEALGESTAIPLQFKDNVMDALMTGDWDAVQGMVHGSNAMQTPPTINDDPFMAFRRMAIAIFYASRKIQQLDLQARRLLGSSILRTTNKAELMHLFLERLVHATTLDVNARLLIANDVLEGRYYRLLLPDRFDCDTNVQVRGGDGRGTTDARTQHRQQQQQQSSSLDRKTSIHNDGTRVSLTHVDASLSATSLQVEHVWIDESTQECPICLGHVEYPTTLRCHHVFCRDCIVDWAHEFGNDIIGNTTNNSSRPGHNIVVSCPVCRQVADIPTATTPLS